MNRRVQMDGSMISQNKFSIDDAFEENGDDPIRVYGSTTERSPLKAKDKNVEADCSINVWVETPGQQRLNPISDDVRNQLS